MDDAQAMLKYNRKNDLYNFSKRIVQKNHISTYINHIFALSDNKIRTSRNRDTVVSRHAVGSHFVLMEGQSVISERGLF